ncbi:ABC transporter substrate-binding protein [Acidithiobacillus thiooxidans]|uniref:ABC transporter substrate-binding protein n=1 Tax=Acidithiobacillus thiooxidans TaxID=930 RepID=UPI002866E532|nr:ABC transporter substrate-binding protein [Acidithiobacillus thiooxidans]MDR7926785.1 ABC transporter substrate-binding protein [Acidithiobacillus thiooxidans]
MIISIFRLITCASIFIVLNLINNAYGESNTHLKSLTTIFNNGSLAPETLTSLLPFVNSDSGPDVQIVSLIFSPLIYINANEEIDWSKSIARSIKFSPNRKIVIIKLKKWKWTDGHFVNAEDVTKAIDMLKKIGKKNDNYGMGGMPEIINSYQIVNNSTIKLILKRKVDPLWFELNGISQIIPIPWFKFKHYSIHYLERNQDSIQLVSVTDGQFMVSKYHYGRYIKLLKNYNYSGPLPGLNDLTYLMPTSVNDEVFGLLSGKIQAGYIPHSLLFHYHDFIGDMKTCRTNGWYGFTDIELNYSSKKSPFFKNKNVRRALQLAINERMLIKVVFHGVANYGFSPVPTTPQKFLSPKMKSLLLHPMSMYNPPLADQLLDSAGWKVSRSGIRINKDGKHLCFTLLVSNVSHSDILMSQLIQQEWRRIGVRVKIRILSGNAIDSLMTSNKWEAQFFTWTYYPDYFPSGDGLFNTDGGLNKGHFKSEYLDHIIKKNENYGSLKYLFKYQNFMQEKNVEIFLPYRNQLVAYKKNLSMENLIDSMFMVDCNNYVSSTNK